MVSEDHQQTASGAGVGSVPPMARGLLAELAEADQPTRFRVLAEILANLADRVTDESANAAMTEELAAMSRSVKEQKEKNSTLNDRIKTLEVDLKQSAAHLESEKSRATEFKAIADEQTSRLDQLQDRVKELEGLLESRNREVHKANVDNENLTLQMQRLDAKAHDQSKMLRLEEQTRALEAENQRLREQADQLRADKNLELERISGDLATVREEVAAKKDIDFPILWSRLASTDPPLVEGHLQPNEKAGERLFDSFAELVKFEDEFDQLMRPFLTRWTAGRPRLRAVWEAYARGAGIRDTVQQIIVPEGGRPTGILRNQLRGLYKWTEAALWGCEAAIEHIEPELREFMRRKEPFGSGSDPNRKISDFILQNGPAAFSDHMKGVRSDKIAEFMGQGPRRRS